MEEHEDLLRSRRGESRGRVRRMRRWRKGMRRRRGLEAKEEEDD